MRISTASFEVAHELADDRGLLRVLLAEVRALRADDVEENEADGCDAAEVAGTCVALEPAGDVFDLDPGLEARRIDLVDVGREHDVHAGGLRELEVALLVARIRVEIGLLVELARVDEQGDDDDLVLRARRTDQREMPVVKRTHRRNEPDPGDVPQLCAQLVDGVDGLHVASASVAPASVS